MFVVNHRNGSKMKQNFIKNKLSLRTIKLEVISINCPISFNNEIYFGRFTCFLIGRLCWIFCQLGQYYCQCKAICKFSSCILRAPYMHYFIFQKEEGYFAQLLRLGGFLQDLLVGVRTQSLSRNRRKDSPPRILCDLCMFKFMITFALCFKIG